ncbi:type II toxin-antitoxin system RelE/ParE family toxin [Psychroflexus sp. CAK8W]|uniref:Type II toxin-antitoxin system RelE/ParE family toxin n=1 Tax=Psychroflexus longus TaxID=2873596 RepID=A0ABS7XKG1_9FLAO|nr:type II toxin-antitoxin system RelE/ParE family toxin [Psychroflexus longus]MBZ9779460.1 type II toxin-antitoxin system RelE/ParE family toxin [Psychroflexus longus]
MKSGYKVFWTKHALSELKETYEYLEKEFTDKEIRKLSVEIDYTINLISRNPELFPLSDFRGIRRVVIKTYNTLYYRLEKNQIEILSFYNNRKRSKTDNSHQ